MSRFFNIVGALTAKVTGAVGALLCTAVLAKFGGVSAVGQYALLMSSIVLLYTFAKYGLEQVVVKDFAENTECASARVFSGVKVVVCASLFGLLLLFSLNIYLELFPVESILIIYGSAAASAISAVFIYALRGRGKIILSSFLDYTTLGSLIRAVLLLVTLYFSLMSLEYAVLAASILASGIALLLFVRLNNFRLRGAGSLLEVERAGRPLLVFSFCVVLMGNLDTFFVAHFFGESVLGEYDIAFKVSSMFSLVLAAISSALAPEVAKRNSNGDLRGMKSTLMLISYGVTFMACCLAIVIYLFYPLLLGFLGVESQVSRKIFAILMIGQIANIFFGPVSVMLAMVGAKRLLVTVTVKVVFLNAFLNYVFAHYWGAEGVAIATAVSLCLHKVWMYFAFRKETGVGYLWG